MTERSRSLSTLTEKTFFPLSLVIIALGAVAGGAWWLSAMYQNQVQVNNRLDSIEHSISANVARVEKALSDSANNSVSDRDLRMWIMTLKAQNKDKLEIPDWLH